MLCDFDDKLSNLGYYYEDTATVQCGGALGDKVLLTLWNCTARLVMFEVAVYNTHVALWDAYYGCKCSDPDLTVNTSRRSVARLNAT